MTRISAGPSPTARHHIAAVVGQKTRETLPKQSGIVGDRYPHGNSA